MDSFLVTLVVVVIAALSSWLQQRAQSQHDASEPHAPPRPGTPPVPRRPPQRPASPGWPTLEGSLEDQLKRLLGGEPPPTPKPHQPAPPAHSTKPPVVVHRSPAPPMVPVPALSQAPPAAHSWTATPTPMHGSGSGYSQAQHLHENVADKLRTVDQQTQRHDPKLSQPQRAKAGAVATSIRAIRRNPEAARQAFVASLVFGLPKSLEE